MVKLMTNEELETVTKSLQNIDDYVHQELGDEYDLDMLGCVLTELVDAGTVTAKDCIAYLYAIEPLEYANQVVMDFFDSDVQKLVM